jgi:putative ABC transport system permease protein
MQSLTLTLRHLARYWKLNLVVMTGMLIGSVFASSPPLLATVIAGQSLSQSLADATPARRNLQIRGSRLSDELGPMVDEVVEEMKQEQVEIRQLNIFADPTIVKASGESDYTGAILFFELWSFDRLAELVEIREGRLPHDGVVIESGFSPILEAALGSDAAAHMDLGIGDVLVTDDHGTRIRVVGIVEPIDPRSEIWWGDDRLLPFNAQRESGLSDYDTITISLLLTPQTMLLEIPGHGSNLRVIIDQNAITVKNADSIREELLSLEARVSAQGLQLETGLIDLIQNFRDQTALASISLMLLTAQSFLAILYTLGMISTYLLDQSRLELSMLANRGFSRGQILRIFAFEMALLAFGLALPLGPLISFTGFSLWSVLSGTPTPGSVPVNSWILAIGATVFAWLALVVPLFFAVRESVFDWQRRLTRPKTNPLGRTLALDGALIAFGGIAYWQLRETGSVVRNAEGGMDPVLLIGPTLLLFAIGLVFLRLFPYLLRAVARLMQSLRGLPLAVGLNRLARLPTGPNRIVLLISLTIGLSFFASVFSRSVSFRQSEMAEYLSGADLRITQSHESERATDDLANVLALSGVKAGSQVFRTRSRWGEGSGIVVDFLAVDPETFAQVSHFPKGYRDISMDPIMAVLRSPSSDAIPIVLSHDAPPHGAQIGDRVEYRVGREAYDFEVRGIIINFPTLTTPFVVANLPELSQIVDLGSTLLAVEGTRELWVDVDPDQHETLVGVLEEQALSEVGLASYRVNRVADDAFERLGSYQADLVARTAITAFRLNTIALGTLSVGGFLLIQICAIRSRRQEFAVLQTLGLSIRQLLGLLFLEGSILMTFGVGLGIGIGFGLANLMRPFLSITLTASLGGGAIDQIAFHWPSIARDLLVYLSFYILSLLLLLGGLVYSNSLRMSRISEE